MHTHLSPPTFGKHFQWGIDELPGCHYLAAELFRLSPFSPEEYWALPKERQAETFWEIVSVRNTPFSEDTHGVVAALQAFGFHLCAGDLREACEFFAAQGPERGLIDLETGPDERHDMGAERPDAANGSGGEFVRRRRQMPVSVTL